MKGIVNVEQGKGASVRISPMAEAESVAILPSAAEVELLGYGDGWYLIDAGEGVQGYVAGSMITALDGIDGLGKLKIFKKKDKNGKSTATVTATPAVVKKVANGQKKSGLISKLKANTNSAVKAAARNNLKNAMRATVDPKKRLETAIKNAKKAGVTEAEIKDMASLNGLDGKLLNAIKNVGQKIVNTGKKIVGAGQKAEEVQQVINQPAQATQPVATQPAQAMQPAQPIMVQPINQNQNTMDDEKKSKIKKIAIAGAALLGVATIGVIAYKKSKKNAAANNGKGALNGVRKRRKKSKKSKKNTGNKMLNLK